jgi:metallo-beta-lactamase class B
MLFRRARLVWLLVLAALCPPLHADSHPDWTTPIAPFKIADNLYYVGSRDLASYLITTPSGDILINSSLQSSPPLIERSIEQLGFHLSDVKILLISHAHWDHDAGSAAILRRTHAKYMVMDADVPVVESGGAKDPAYSATHYPKAHVGRVLHDGDQVTLGGVTLTAHKTPGHTAGCTTWTLQAVSGGKLRNVVIVGSWSVNSEFRLVDRPGHLATYPGIAADFEHTFALLKSLPCDIFLGAHGGYFDMVAKLQRAQGGAGESVWIDPEGYREAVATHGAAFRAELAKEQQAAGQK